LVSDPPAVPRMWDRYGALYGAFRSETPSSRTAAPNGGAPRGRSKVTIVGS
jgi:hypothetical protein